MRDNLKGKKAIMAAAAIRYLFHIRNHIKHGDAARAFCREWIAILRGEIAAGAVA